MSCIRGFSSTSNFEPRTSNLVRTMSETVLITGASGLLGRALVARFADEGFQVLAHYHLHPGKDDDQRAVAGRRFFHDRRHRRFFVEKREHAQPVPLPDQQLRPDHPAPHHRASTGRDLLADFQQQVVPAVDISHFLIARAPLQMVLTIGFEYSGEIRSYQRILGYAMAKNALLLLTRSWAAAYPGVCFNLFSPPTLEKAEFLPRQAQTVAPELVADRIFRILSRRRSGFHYRYTNPPQAAKE